MKTCNMIITENTTKESKVQQNNIVSEFSYHLKNVFLIIIKNSSNSYIGYKTITLYLRLT